MPVCFLGTPGHCPGLQDRGGTAPQHQPWGGPDWMGKQMTQLPGNRASFSLAAAPLPPPPRTPGSAPRTGTWSCRGSHPIPLRALWVWPSPLCHEICEVTGEKIPGGSDGDAGVTAVPVCTAMSQGLSPALQPPPLQFLLSQEPGSLPAASQHNPGSQPSTSSATTTPVLQPLGAVTKGKKCLNFPPLSSA